MLNKARRRKIKAAILPYVVNYVIVLLWKTCRIERQIGTGHLEKLLQQGDPVIPCYWHQQQVFCLRFLLEHGSVEQGDQGQKGLSLAYLISPSRDGDIAIRLVQGLGITIIRGSATRGGAQALREIYTVIKNQRLSPVITPDGPTGPPFEFKPGVAMLSQLSGAPMLPIAYSANRYWQLRSWDLFIVPKPFARIVVAVGEPVSVAKRGGVDKLPDACALMNERMKELVELTRKEAALL